MKKVLQTLIILTLISLSCYNNEDKVDLTYKDAIKNFVKQKDADTIIINNMTDFVWDRMYIFSPYSPPQRVNDALGFQWDKYKEIGFCQKEHAVLFVFIRNYTVIDWIIVPRSKSDYLPAATVYAYTPETALFKKYRYEMHSLFKREQLLKIPAVFNYPPQPGVYTKDGWKYELNIRLRKTKREKRESKLFYNNLEITGKNGDTMSCPLGKFMYFSGRQYLAFHGWHNQGKFDRPILDPNGFFLKEIKEETQFYRRADSLRNPENYK